MGVFASRSPYRPNRIGLSVVRLESVETQDANVSLTLSGVDLLDRTPVLDIKPYIGYVDNIPYARAGYAPEPPKKKFRVEFTALALSQIKRHPKSAELSDLISAILEIDPRPAYMQRQAPGRVHGMLLYDFDLRWKVGDAENIVVLELVNNPVSDQLG